MADTIPPCTCGTEQTAEQRRRQFAGLPIKHRRGCAEAPQPEAGDPWEHFVVWRKNGRYYIADFAAGEDGIGPFPSEGDAEAALAGLRNRLQAHPTHTDPGGRMVPLETWREMQRTVRSIVEDPSLKGLATSLKVAEISQAVQYSLGIQIAYPGKEETNG